MDEKYEITSEGHVLGEALCNQGGRDVVRTLVDMVLVARRLAEKYRDKVVEKGGGHGHPLTRSDMPLPWEVKK